MNCLKTQQESRKGGKSPIPEVSQEQQPSVSTRRPAPRRPQPTPSSEDSRPAPPDRLPPSVRQGGVSVLPLPRAPGFPLFFLTLMTWSIDHKGFVLKFTRKWQAFVTNNCMAVTNLSSVCMDKTLTLAPFADCFDFSCLYNYECIFFFL